MAEYRRSRNIESSFKDFIIEQLETDGWNGIRTELSFTDVYLGKTPCILIEEPETQMPKRLEIGNSVFIKYPIVNIRIFATGEGQRKDLKDWLIDSLESGIDYFEYTIGSGQVITKSLAGRIEIMQVLEDRKELVNVENLNIKDRNRHKFSFKCHVSKI
ncbi:MAG: hypothetical protein V1901_03785 [Patescibacteria group bacterium]